MQEQKSGRLVTFFWAVLVIAVLAGIAFFLNNMFRVEDQKVEELEEVNVVNNSINVMSKAIITTNFGVIEVELFGDKAPKTVLNFATLAKAGFYNGTKFHRVIKDFMIQGGDPLSKDDSRKNFWGTGGPGYQFEDEFNDEQLVRGVLAMANSGPNTNGSQFFIVTAPATPWLDGKHTAFGRVVSGIEAVVAIEAVETEGKGSIDRPIQPVIVEKIEIVN